MPRDAVGLIYDMMIVAGGFAVVQPDSKLSINAVEGFALEDFSAEVSYLIFTFEFPLD